MYQNFTFGIEPNFSLLICALRIKNELFFICKDKIKPTENQWEEQVESCPPSEFWGISHIFRVCFFFSLFSFSFKLWNRFSTLRRKSFWLLSRILQENERKLHYRKTLHKRYMQTDCLFQLHDSPVTIGYNTILQLRIICSWLGAMQGDVRLSDCYLAGISLLPNRSNYSQCSQIKFS